MIYTKADIANDNHTGLLIVATSATPAGVRGEIANGRRQRLDYLELARLFDADYVDYNNLRTNHAIRQLESTLRLDVQQALHVSRLVREQKYCAVLSMSERVGIPLSFMLDSKIRQVMIAFHLLSPLKLRLLRSLRVLRHSDTVAVPTYAEAEALLRRGDLEAHQVVTLPTWVDADFFRPATIVALDEPGDHILSVGLSYRDYPTLIRALRLLPHVACEVRAASSWVRPRTGYEREAIPANVSMRDMARPSVLRARYQASRFVVLPIRPTTQWSAGGTAVLEAQAMGKAVIATRTPGMADYIQDGETGILVEGDNPVALAEAIDHLWTNPAEAAAMGRRARSQVESAFSLEHWVERLTAALSGVGIDMPAVSKDTEHRRSGLQLDARPS